jgi:hypothetical protein
MWRAFSKLAVGGGGINSVDHRITLLVKTVAREYHSIGMQNTDYCTKLEHELEITNRRGGE